MRYANSACALGALVVSLSAWSVEGDEAERGTRLFQDYGCTNCHGADGVHPTSRHVPVPRSKPADYIFNTASAIIRGENSSSKTRFMHDQFCVGAVKEEGCYPAPTVAELRLIAEWLAGNGTLAKKKTTSQGLYVSSVQAYEQLEGLGDKALFIDVRTRSEVAFLGMPTVADANIPYMTANSFDEWDERKKTFKLRPNSEFVKRVEVLAASRGLTKEDPIYLNCRSGSRSAKAANILAVAGYTQVYTVTDGFEGDKAKVGPRKGERVVNGWKNAGLPWSYKLDKHAMYWEF